MGRWVFIVRFVRGFDPGVIPDLTYLKWNANLRRGIRQPIGTIVGAPHPRVHLRYVGAFAIPGEFVRCKEGRGFLQEE